MHVSYFPCSCFFAPSCQSSHQKKTDLVLLNPCLLPPVKKIVLHYWIMFRLLRLQLVLAFPHHALNFLDLSSLKVYLIIHCAPSLEFILTLLVCVFSAGMVPMQQQQQQQQQGFPMVQVLQPNMQSMMGMNFGGQMPPGAMPMQVSLFSHWEDSISISYKRL